MRKFWGFYDNGKYRVGCNGMTVYVYDQNNNELRKFKDIRHVYVGTFQPGTNIFVAKSTEGTLAIYDLDKMEMIKKIVVTRIGAQDEGFAFSPDGAYFYNIEKPFDSTKTQLTIYRTIDYKISKVLFNEDKVMVLDTIEFDKCTGVGYVLGFKRGSDGVSDYGFIGKVIGENISEIKRLTQDTYDYVSAYKSWEMTGFTERALEWSRIREYSEKPSVSLKQVYDG